MRNCLTFLAFFLTMFAVVLAGAVAACRLFAVPMQFGWDERIMVFTGCAMHAALWTIGPARRRKPVPISN